MSTPHDDDLIRRTAFYLGRVLRGATDAIAYPYRLVAGDDEDEASETPGDRPRADEDLGSWRHRDRQHSLTPRPLSTPRAGDETSAAVCVARPCDAIADDLELLDPLAAARVAAADGLPALSDALADPDPEVRILALETISEFSDDHAGRLLAELLHDAEPRVRAAAAAAAARARAASVVFSLILAIDDPDAEVRLAAKEALQVVTGAEVDLQPNDPPDVRQALVEDLKRWWKERRLSELAAAVEGDDEVGP